MFITLEGLDGSGKTTQAGRIAAYLRERGHSVLLTREPGGTDIGDQIRDILMHHKNDAMQPRTELLLFCASRAQLVEQVIRPFLSEGGIVLCDRYIDSTLAYQGFGHGLDLTALKTILHFATGGLQPDRTLFFDISPQEAIRRKQQASLFGEEFNRLDAMQLAFRERVYDGYQQLIAAEPERWVRVDAQQTVDALFGDVIAQINDLLGLRA